MWAGEFCVLNKQIVRFESQLGSGEHFNLTTLSELNRHARVSSRMRV